MRSRESENRDRDLGQRVLATVLEAVAGPHDAGRPVVEVVEQALDALPLQRGEDHVLRRRCVGVGDQVAEVGVAVVADRGVQRHGVLRPAHQLMHPLDRHAQRDGELLGLGVVAQLAGELTRHVAHPVDVFDEVHGQPHRALLLRDRPADRLADPPRRIGRELVSTHVVELLDRAHQAGVALLDQVEHRHPGPHVTARDRHHQAQVGPDEPVLRPLTLGNQPLQLVRCHTVGKLVALQQVLGVEPSLDRLGQLDL